MNLMQAKEGREYIIRRVRTADNELEAFLFTLGCYSGESIKLISRRRHGCIIGIKNGRYSIDKNLASAIEGEAV